MNIPLCVIIRDVFLHFVLNEYRLSTRWREVIRSSVFSSGVDMTYNYQTNISFTYEMKKSILIFCLFTVSSNLYPQDEAKQIARTDSLVNFIDSEQCISQIIRCDTNELYHTGSFTVYCVEFYIHNNKLIKAAFQVSTFPIPDIRYTKEYTSHNAFYFHGDTLIKAIRKDSSNSVTPIDEYYFTSENLSKLESLRFSDPQKFKRIDGYTRFANDFLLRFKKNRID